MATRTHYSIVPLVALFAVAGSLAPAHADDSWVDGRPSTPKKEEVVVAPKPSGPDTMRLALDFALVVPLSDWSDYSGVGLGGLLRFEARVAPIASLTARVGLIGHHRKNSGRTVEIPLIFPGVKFYFSDFYVALEAGLVNFGVLIDLGKWGFVGKDEMKFGFAGGVGYVFDRLDVCLQLFTLRFGEMDEVVGLMFNVGYAFITF